MTTMSNSNASCFRVVLSCVELRWVLTIFKKNARKALRVMVVVTAVVGYVCMV